MARQAAAGGARGGGGQAEGVPRRTGAAGPQRVALAALLVVVVLEVFAAAAIRALLLFVPVEHMSLHTGAARAQDVAGARVRPVVRAHQGGVAAAGGPASTRVDVEQVAMLTGSTSELFVTPLVAGPEGVAGGAVLEGAALCLARTVLPQELPRLAGSPGAEGVAAWAVPHAAPAAAAGGGGRPCVEEHLLARLARPLREDLVAAVVGRPEELLPGALGAGVEGGVGPGGGQDHRPPRPHCPQP